MQVKGKQAGETDFDEKENDFQRRVLTPGPFKAHLILQKYLSHDDSV